MILRALLRDLRHRRKIILAKQKIDDKIALVKYETIFFLFICLYFFFVSLILFFPVYFLYLFLFSFLFFFSPFNHYLCIFIIILFFAHLFSSPSENHKKGDWKPNTLKMSVAPKIFHLLFPRCCFGWGADGGHGGCSPAAWQWCYRRWSWWCP